MPVIIGIITFCYIPVTFFIHLILSFSLICYLFPVLFLFL